MTTEILTFSIFTLGILTCVLSLFASGKFYAYKKSLTGSSKSLSNAVAFQLLGEMIIGLGTLIFAYSAHAGLLPNWSLEFQSLLRFVMFTATSLTTFHLVRTLIKIEKE